MKSDFRRTDSLFSLCGLNCGLCPMYIRGDCGGCFTDSPCYPSCPIASCSVRHGNVEYCYQCAEYPCRRYEGIDLHDSLISHRNQKKDLVKAKEIGIDSYLREQRSKKEILNRLLKDYDDGIHLVFFCLAVNMLPVDNLEELLREADEDSGGTGAKEKAAYIEKKLYDCAEVLGIELKLRD